jgi:uncharacterized protein YbbK (DUF523 family)
VDGTDYGEGGTFAGLLALPNVVLTTFCPEDYSFGTPRDTPDCHGGDGFDVLDGRARILTQRGADWTRGMIAAAEEMVLVARENRVDLALLQHVSAACGTSVIYSGHRHLKTYQQGAGVAGAALMRAGIPVVGEQDRRSLEHLRAHLDPAHEVDVDARDCHETDWYRRYFDGSPR